MDTEAFWTLIDETRPEPARRGLLRRRPFPDLAGHAARLVERLVALGAEETLAFDRIWHELTVRAYHGDLWDAAYVINGGCSDDCFDYFRDYLISLGREVYEEALRDPESLADVELPHDRVDYEEISYVAQHAWERLRGDEPMPPYETPTPDSPAGEPHDDEELAALYPRLAARFGWG